MAEGSGTVLPEGHLSDQREARGHRASREDGLTDLGQAAEGLQQDEIDPRLGERGDLLGERRPGLVDADAAEGHEVAAQRPHRAGDEGRGAHSAARLAGQGHPGPVDLCHPVAQAVLGQLEAIGAEGVGLEQLRSGLQMTTMNSRRQLRRAEVDGVEAIVERDALGVEHRAHGTIG